MRGGYRLKRLQSWEQYQSLVGGKPSRVAGYIDEIRRFGYLPRPPREVLEFDDATVAGIYAGLAGSGWTGQGIASPVAGYADSSWMVQSDFCFVNVRACGLDRNRPGHFPDTMRLLLALPATAIHLAPFFECVFGNVYAVNSLMHINPECIHQPWAEAGLGGEEQLGLLLDAAHILGKTVGFDLEPHTAQFSRVVLDSPGFFRWLALSGDRKSLRGDLTQDEMLEPGIQDSIIEEVRSIVQKEYERAGITHLEDPALDTGSSREVQETIIRDLIARGFWTIPCHTWGGVGLPGYIGYNHQDGYPLFEYLDAEGADQSEHAFGMLTPVVTARGLSVNTAPTQRTPSEPWQPGIEFLAGFYPAVSARFGFDFLRLDYVDHVFDSVLEGKDDIPLADRMTPAVMRACIQRAREWQPSTGAMAERMGYDLPGYASAGFDLILGADVLRQIDIEFLDDMLRFQKEIAEANRQRRTPASIQYAIDTHDTGHPQINALPADSGRQALLLRILLAGLGSAGKGRRPMYEVMGNQDMTTGLYEANNQPVSLEWRNDREFFEQQEKLRRFLSGLRPVLAVSEIRQVQIEAGWAFWCIDRMDGVRLRLCCLCRPETGSLDADARDIRLYPFTQYWFDEARIEEYNIQTGALSFVPIEVDGTIVAGRMAEGAVRIFVITENSQGSAGIWQSIS